MTDYGVCQCGAKAVGRDPQGIPRCCPACVFNPLGCRCRFGELGVAETQDWDPWDYYEEDGPLDLEDQLESALSR